MVSVKAAAGICPGNLRFRKEKCDGGIEPGSICRVDIETPLNDLVLFFGAVLLTIDGHGGAA